MITEIDKIILEKAAKDTVKWNKIDSDIIVSVNISGSGFKSDLEDSVKEVLRNTGLNPKNLDLEITEQEAMSKVNEAIDIMTKLREL